MEQLGDGRTMSIHRPRMIYLNAIWIALDIEFNKSLIVLQAAFPCIRFAGLT